MSTSQKITQFEDLGRINYAEAWQYQEKRFQEVVTVKESNRKSTDKATTPNFLLFCEHPHVYTLGKSGKDSHLLINEDLLKAKGAEFHRINRGGDITYHGPGQVVAYPILDLDNFRLSIKTYIHSLEEVIIMSLKHYGIDGYRSPGATGVWLDVDHAVKARKIAAIGVRTSHWVSMHGFAFNINTDLNFFDYIVPCGIQGKAVTSLEKELGRSLPMEEVKELIKEQFTTVFGMQLDN